MKHFIRHLWIVPVTVTLSACSIGKWFTRGSSIEVIEAGRAQLCSAEEPAARVQIFDSAAAVVAWEQRTGISLNIDGMLANGRYALIEMGLHNTGGYGIAVSREARHAGDTLNIFATFFSPAPGAMTTQMITSPCVLVRLPTADYVFVDVYDQDGVRRASSARTN